MTGNLPPLVGKATLDLSEFRRSIQQIQSDLRNVSDLGKRIGTIRITADLSAAKDVQKATRAIYDSLNEVVPTDMQRRISNTFGAFTLGANSAKASAAVFEAQASAVRAKIDELDRAIRITRADFQAGFGEAKPEEIAQLTAEMSRLQGELKDVGDVARREFGDYSKEAQKVANANRLAEATAAAARGEISRLGLASQVKLGVGGALGGLGGQASVAAAGLFSFSQASDSARVSNALFGKTVEKTGQSSAEASKIVAKLQDTLQISGDSAREGIRGLLRQGFTLEQAYKALEGAGASALAAGRSAGEGVEAFVDAVTSGDSARLASIGVSENLSTFLQKEAKARGVTVDALDKQARATAAVNLITAATGDEVGDLTALLGGMSGTVGSASRELESVQKQLGETLTPILTNGIRTLTGFLEVFDKIPDSGKSAIAILGASAIAVGVLAGPVSNLAQGYTAISNGLKSVLGAASALTENAGAAVKVTEQLGEGIGSQAQSTNALVDIAQRADAGYAALNARLAVSVANHLAAGGSANVMSLAFLRAIGSTALLTSSLGALSIAAAAALGGVGLVAAGIASVSVKLINETQAIYAGVEEANQKSFDQTMARVATLRKEGTELSRAKAQILIAQQQLADAEQGTLTKVNIFGKRTYERDEEAIKRLQARIVELGGVQRQLFTEAQRRGALNVALTEDQTKAVKELQKTIEGRAFDLKISGLTEMGRDLAQLGKEFGTLREEFKKPFTINGKLMDIDQTPALRDGLAELDAQLAADAAAIRTKYADEAVKTAQESAYAVQRIEIEAMTEGADKKTALRDLELQELKRAADEQIKTLKDFPAQQVDLEDTMHRQIAAKRKVWAEEDRQQVIDGQKRIADAGKRARDAAVAALADGYLKEELVRRNALQDLRDDIAERVRLESDPKVKAAIQKDGQKEILAKIQEQARERAQVMTDAQEIVDDATRAARDTSLAATADSASKEAKVRENALTDLSANLQKQLEQFKGTEAQRTEFIKQGNLQILALYQQQQADLRKIRAGATQTVTDAEKSARAAEIAAIQNEVEKKRALRNQELEDLRTNANKRLENFRGTAEEQQRIVDAYERERAAKLKVYAAEDDKEAKARTARIVKAIQEVQAAQDGADQAGRGNQAAAYELNYSRRLAAAQGNAVAVANIEAQASRDRAKRAEQDAATQLEIDQRRLDEGRMLALETEGLSSEERKAIWQKYYADLSTLDGKAQADRKTRLQQQEEQERVSAENIRLARIQQASAPVERATSLITQLEASKQLALSDREVLEINGQINAAREQQLTALQGQLDGANGVKLNAQERQRAEEQIAGIQRDQLVAQRSQVDAARELVASALDRLDAEAAYAELTATTEADRVKAQQRQLAVAQTRVRELDNLIAAEGREKERNKLIDQRYGLLTQIANLSKTIDGAPLEADQRRLDLYKAQAQAQLILKGLGDDKQANANLTVQIAAQELNLANQRVAAARTELELQAALIEQAGARAGLAQALNAQRAAPTAAVVADTAAQDALERQFKLETDLQDVAEARAKAMLQINGLADDAVTKAEQELSLTQQRLALTVRQLAQGGSSTTQTGLLKQQADLLERQITQEYQLAEARRARAQLAAALQKAEAGLNREMAGGKLGEFAAATLKLSEARIELTRVERTYAAARLDYERIPSTANAQKLKEATDSLTGAIQTQRTALKGLANDYRAAIQAGDGVRDAGKQLDQAVYGEAGRPYDEGRERERLRVIEERRNAAAKELADALKTGDKAAIQRTAQELSVQEERYKKQAELVQNNRQDYRKGQKAIEANDKAQLAAVERINKAKEEGNLSAQQQAEFDLRHLKEQAKQLKTQVANVTEPLTGQEEIKKLADQVDALGIQYDKEAVALAERARIADQESAAAMSFSGASDVLQTSATQFESNIRTLVDALQGVYQKLAESMAAASGQEVTGSKSTPAVVTVKPLVFDPAALDAQAAAITKAMKNGAAATSAPVSAAQFAQQLSQQIGKMFDDPYSLLKPEFQYMERQRQMLSSRPAQEIRPVTNNSTVNWEVEVNVTAAPGLSAEAVADNVISKLKNEARRNGRGGC